MSSVRYYFLSSVRQGLATAIQQEPDENNSDENNPDENNSDENNHHRARIEVVLRATARRQDASEPDDAEIKHSVQLYGPGDILGFHERIVSRCYPEPNVGDFEPDYFPAIEFADADFAWRFTANQADEQTGKLMPWITLVVLVSEDQGNGIRREFEEGPRSDRNLPRYIKVKVDIDALPDLQNVSRWAHVHITGEDSLVKDNLKEIIRTEPERAVCRLLCPRRLAPGVRYTAFVVPTFKLGVLAGRGLKLDPAVNALEEAWKGDDSDKSLPYYNHSDPEAKRLELPYYYRWEFRTGMRGDFEHLVRLLERRDLSGLGIGRREIDCEKPGFGVHGVDRPGLEAPQKHFLGMEGALQPVDIQYTPWGRDPADESAKQPGEPLQEDLAELLNRADQALQTIPANLTETSAFEDITVRVLPSGTAVRIAWRTSLAATSHIDYGETTNYEHSVDHPDLKQKHELELKNLEPGKVYHFRIVARAADTVVETSDYIFRMPLPTVVPPIYGRWHRGKSTVNEQKQEEWLDVLNLDPRHRAAAGLGSEVIRKQQEPLMASAWDQLGAIESANDILRRAQFGREGLLPLYRRLDQLPIEDFLRVTRSVQQRVIVDDAESGKKMTATKYLETKSRIPAAALDPAFRHIMRPRGPIRKRQGAGRSTNMLARLASGELEAAGPPPKPLGTTRLCDITRRLKESIAPTVSLQANPTRVGVGGSTVLTWSSTNATSRVASGGWSGSKPASGSETVGPLTSPGPGLGIRFDLICKGPGGSASDMVMVTVSSGTPGDDGDVGVDPGGGGGDLGDVVVDPGGGGGDLGDVVVDPGGGGGDLDDVVVDPGGGNSDLAGGGVVRHGLWTEGGEGAHGPHIGVSDEITSGGVSDTGIVAPPPSRDDAALRFCDGRITCQEIIEALKAHAPFENVANVPDPNKTAQLICGTLNNWLDKKPKEGESQPPKQPPGFLDEVKKMIFTALDPNRTVVERTKKRLRLAGVLMQRFQEGAKGDPLDPILWTPEFPQPMYEALRDISHDLLLPGVEKIPQNTISLLRTNRRFVESYLCGCNHEFAGELLWRGYPTDQRGSYFRQFWDVSGYVPREDELQQLLKEWLRGRGVQSVAELAAEAKKRIISRNLEKALDELLNKWLTEAGVTTVDELPDKQKHIIRRLQDVGVEAVSEIPPDEVNELVEELIKPERLAEKLKDVMPLINWHINRLGHNQTRPEETLVLLIRGDLLKRYPNTLIYAIDAVPCDGANGELVPGLPEYLKDSSGKPIDDETRIQAILNGIRRIFPIFRATLPPDLTFFGFPFEKDEARGFDEDKARGIPGELVKYFVIEEQVTEPRFGLDAPTDKLLASWDDLSWSHFGLSESFGDYLDAAPIAPSGDNNSPAWTENASSATRAWITLQKPVRIAVHAKQMLPNEPAVNATPSPP